MTPLALLPLGRIKLENFARIAVSFARMIDVLPQLMRLVVLTAGVWLLGDHALALPVAKQTRIVEKARTLLDTPYRFGGRLRGADAGIDCQGLVLFAIQPISACGWKSYSVFPTVSLPAKELGAIVAGPVATRDLAGLALEPGDVVWLLGFAQNPAENSIGVLDEKPVWVWHVGLVTDAKRFINADAFAGQVIEVDLHDYLEQHANAYAGVIVTRMAQRPSPQRCRRHAPMQAPKLR